ncbi:MAG: phosphoglycerate mutase (2,3-diphosphoglycerate-independent) [Deltaproteobacteria bacterium RIFCSPHIGHO2_02_FULL_40_11]|nr:MAG: phosphoglycerate mutase (2,3-diphosphoglycerate-independent) [Deltaproteobacteria bacterium RIFCSPHIGHO2_02_FULL_40_11]
MPKTPYILVVLDGFGIAPKSKGNAIQLATAPTFRKLESLGYSQLQASGLEVGLPKGIMGNSEVGHTNLGAGRIVDQDSVRIQKAIETGALFKNPILQTAFKKVKKENSKLHFIGLLSDGGVHSFNTHLYTLLKAATENEIQNIFIHAFLDGRDTPPKSSPKYIEELEKKLKELNCGKIATLSGRFYAMDRDTRWERIEKAYIAMTKAQGQKANSAKAAIHAAFERGETDEFVVPTVIHSEGVIQDKDIVIFFNFRPDRARQLTRAFTEDSFQEFQRKKINLSEFVIMTHYDRKLKLPVLFPPQTLSNVMGEIVSKAGWTQLHIGETEKYAHVTYFFNGGREAPFQGEERILIPSTRAVPTYDLKPEMSAHEITKNVIDHLKKGVSDFMILNFANADMVGHTGNFKATVQAVEILDRCIEKIIKDTQNKKGHLWITADHGNAEQMIHPKTGDLHTAHTTNPVPLYYVSPNAKKQSYKNGILADVMPTLLKVMGLAIPKEVTGKNLLA